VTAVIVDLLLASSGVKHDPAFKRKLAIVIITTGLAILFTSHLVRKSIAYEKQTKELNAKVLELEERILDNYKCFQNPEKIVRKDTAIKR
jgi:hypothetical protein